MFETYRFSGNGNGVFVASNSVYTIYMPSLYNEHVSSSSGSVTIYDTTNVPFCVSIYTFSDSPKDCAGLNARSFDRFSSR